MFIWKYFNEFIWGVFWSSVLIPNLIVTYTVCHDFQNITGRYLNIRGILDPLGPLPCSIQFYNEDSLKVRMLHHLRMNESYLEIW